MAYKRSCTRISISDKVAETSLVNMAGFHSENNGPRVYAGKKYWLRILQDVRTCYEMLNFTTFEVKSIKSQNYVMIHLYENGFGFL